MREKFSLSLFFPFESAIFHFQRSRPFTTLFLLFWCGLRDCVYSVPRQGARNGCGEAEGGSRDLPITRRRPWTCSPREVCRGVCLWTGTPLGRTASTLQTVMVMLMQLNRMPVWKEGCYREGDAGNKRKAGTMWWLSILATTSRLDIHNRLHPFCWQLLRTNQETDMNVSALRMKKKRSPAWM